MICTFQLHLRFRVFVIAVGLMGLMMVKTPRQTGVTHRKQRDFFKSPKDIGEKRSSDKKQSPYIHKLYLKGTCLGKNKPIDVNNMHENKPNTHHL